MVWAVKTEQAKFYISEYRGEGAVRERRGHCLCVLCR